MHPLSAPILAPMATGTIAQENDHIQVNNESLAVRQVTGEHSHLLLVPRTDEHWPRLLVTRARKRARATYSNVQRSGCLDWVQEFYEMVGHLWSAAMATSLSTCHCRTCAFKLVLVHVTSRRDEVKSVAP